VEEAFGIALALLNDDRATGAANAIAPQSERIVSSVGMSAIDA